MPENLKRSSDSWSSDNYRVVGSFVRDRKKFYTQKHAHMQEQARNNLIFPVYIMLRDLTGSLFDQLRLSFESAFVQS